MESWDYEPAPSHLAKVALGTGAPPRQDTTSPPQAESLSCAGASVHPGFLGVVQCTSPCGNLSDVTTNHGLWNCSQGPIGPVLPPHSSPEALGPVPPSAPCLRLFVVIETGAPYVAYAGLKLTK